VKSVLLILGLAALLVGQIAAPPSPDPVPSATEMQASAVQEAVPATVTPMPPPGLLNPPPSVVPMTVQSPAGDVPAATANWPPAMVPVTPGSEPRPSVPVQDAQPTAAKPPAFTLVEPPSTANPMPVKATTPTVAPVAPGLTLPPGSAATPCLVLQRTGPAAVKAGQPFSYEIIIRNAGTATAKQARLEEELPPGTRFIAGQPMPVPQGNRLAWNLDNLPAGAERRFQVDVEATNDGDWTAQACLTVSVTSVLTSRVTGMPAKLLEMTGPATVPVGHSVPLPIRVTNTTGAPLTDLLLRVHLSAGLQHLMGDAIEGPLSDLAPGQTKSLTLDAIALQTGNLAVHATLYSGKKSIGETSIFVTATEQPILSLKQVGSPTPRYGAEETFKLEVVNRTMVEARDVTVSDMLPQGLQYLAGDIGANFDPAANAIRWNIGTLPAGQSRQLSFRAMVMAQGACVNRVSARTADGQEAQLNTILRVVQTNTAAH
jgi:uncharacterized repeat protein (TIGR01451 family)